MLSLKKIKTGKAKLQMLHNFYIDDLVFKNNSISVTLFCLQEQGSLSSKRMP